jgi:hypothetical protein
MRRRLSCLVLACLIAQPLLLPAAEEYKSYKIKALPEEVICEMNEHTWALFYWIQAYLEGRIPPGVTLVHVDTHEDELCACVTSRSQAQEILERLRCQPAKERQKNFLSTLKSAGAKIDIEGFIIPAMYMGIISDFIWLRPNFHRFKPDGLFRKEGFFSYYLSAGQFNKYDFCDKDFSLCQLSNPCGLLNFETTRLPAIQGPVLLDIDLDAFGDRDTQRLCGLAFSPQEIRIMIDDLIDLLSAWAPDVYLVTIADSHPQYSSKAALSEKPYLKKKISSSQ